MLLCDSGRCIEEEREFDSVRLRGGHGTVVALLVETFDRVFLGERCTDAEGAVEVGVVQGVSAFGSALHNKYIRVNNFISFQVI